MSCLLRRLGHRIGPKSGRVRSGSFVEKQINGGNPAVLGNDEIGPGVSWCLTRAARYPADQPAIARFRRLGNWLISEFRVSSFDRARDAVDFVTATIDSLAGVVENAIFSVNLVDGSSPASGIVFTEDITKIADQQGRDAVWHGLSPLGIECAACDISTRNGYAGSARTTHRHKLTTS